MDNLVERCAHGQPRGAHRLRFSTRSGHGAGKGLLPGRARDAQPELGSRLSEIETGNVSLYLTDPKAMGGEFAPHTAFIALRVADVAEAKRGLEERGVTFAGEHDTGVCKMAFFHDSEGNALMLHRRYAA